MSYQCQRPCENKTEYGYCKTTYCINPQFSNLGTWQQTILQHGTLKLKQPTNADRIRAMTDEGLAGWIYAHRWNDFDGLLDWLKQEVE
jgi:hypothetical protein